MNQSHIIREFDSDSDDDDEPPQKKEQPLVFDAELEEEFVIDSNSSWKAVEAYLGVKGRPFIFNFAAGSTKIYGYPGLAVEVMDNGFLGCVYMFPTS